MKKPKLSELTLREKIGQTGIVCSGALVGNQKRREIIEKNGFGGLWVTGDQDFMKDYISYEDGNFGHKPTAEEANSWAKEVLKLFKIPPLLPTDGEGGLGGLREGMSYELPSKAYGTTKDAGLCEKYGEIIGAELRASTLNWILSPDCDVRKGRDGKKSTREYSEDYETVSKMACAYIKGVQKMGAAACAKHFPSADPYEVRNSHISATENNMSLKEWEKTQGKVFKDAIDAGVLTVMPGHFSFPAVDDTKLLEKVYIPTSLSHKIVTGLLKEKMGFRGVVVTDDMSMRGARLHYSTRELYIKYLSAGHDMILGIVDDDYVDVVEKAVLSGELSEERIDDACQRVLDLKEKLGLFEENHQDVVPLPQNHFEEVSRHNSEVSEKSIEILSNYNGFLPVCEEKVKKVGIIVQKGTDEAVYKYFKEAIEAKQMEVSVQNGLFYHDDLAKFAQDKDLLVYLLSDKRELQTVRWLLTEAREKSVVAAIDSPCFYEEIAIDAKCFLHAYRSFKETQLALVDKIFKK